MLLSLKTIFLRLLLSANNFLIAYLIALVFIINVCIYVCIICARLHYRICEQHVVLSEVQI